MEVTRSSQELKDAQELVSMLDQLCAGLAVAKPETTIPWRGISLTLQQIKDKLRAGELSASASAQVSLNASVQQTATSVSSNGNSDEAFSYPAPAQPKKRSVIADRIQQSPVGPTRVRELLNTVGFANGRSAEQDGENEAGQV